MPPAALHIASGGLIAHRLLNVADAIDLAQAESLWRAHAGGERRRTRLATAAANELAFEVPPTLEFDGATVVAERTARLAGVSFTSAVKGGFPKGLFFAAVE